MCCVLDYRKNEMHAEKSWKQLDQAATLEIKIKIIYKEMIEMLKLLNAHSMVVFQVSADGIKKCYIIPCYKIVLVSYPGREVPVIYKACIGNIKTMYQTHDYAK